jgi:beta-galactosidase/beta-glucuronidase
VPQDDELHPRPQLTRERWTDLCGPWAFAYDDDWRGLDEGWHDGGGAFDRTIEVPFPPESPASGIGDTGFHPVVWYRRTFRTEDAGLRPGERLLLHLGAVDYRASVWVNGSLVVTHEGGHTPFSADITAALLPDGEQVVTVRAEDLPEDLTQPRGKQDWRERPHEIWYERTTGIWQPVWLEPVPAVRIDRVTWEPDLHRSVLRLRVALAGTQGRHEPLRVALRLTLHGEVIADDVYAVTGGILQRDLPLDGARIHFDRRRYLWSPKHPNLLDAELTLLGPAAATQDEPAPGQEAVLDRVASYCGLRSISTSGGRFVLNGRAYVLRMVLAQNYWPESHLAAPSPAALRREVELVKELGFNGVRIHQKVEDPRFLAWCDRLGVVAWGELPSTLDFDPVTVRRLTAEWTEVLERDRSSPALVAWVPFNESWGIPNMEDDERQRDAVRALYHLTRAIDPTRPVIGNDGWEHLVSDVFGVHDYSPSGELLRERYGSHEALERSLAQIQPFYRSLTLPGVARAGQPLMVTEFGGITYDPDSEDFWNGYGAVGSAEELLARYEELVSALLASPVVGGFCYTQLTDTAQERNGLLDEHRRPKADPTLIAAVNQLDSAAVPADAIMEIQIVHAARRAGAPEPAPRPSAGR